MTSINRATLAIALILVVLAGWHLTAQAQQPIKQTSTLEPRIDQAHDELITVIRDLNGAVDKLTIVIDQRLPQEIVR